MFDSKHCLISYAYVQPLTLQVEVLAPVNCSSSFSPFNLLNLCSLYISPLGPMTSSHDIHFDCYADDAQLYVSVKVGDHSGIIKSDVCLSAVNNLTSAMPVIGPRSDTDTVLIK